MKGNFYAMPQERGGVRNGLPRATVRRYAVSLAEHKRRAGQNVGAKTSAGYHVTTTFPKVSFASSTRWASASSAMG